MLPFVIEIKNFILALQEAVKTIGLIESLLIFFVCITAWLCAKILLEAEKVNKETKAENEKISAKLELIELDQRSCHAERESLRIELQKSLNMNKELKDIKDKSETSLAAMIEMFAKVVQQNG